MVPFRHWNYMGACFQAPHCHTQTMTDGNALCLLIKSVYIAAHCFDKIMCTYRVTYQHLCDGYEQK